MLPDAFKDRIRASLTPRRRRQGIILLALLTVYSLLGLFAAPGLVLTQAQKFVHETLHLDLSVQKVEVNPWVLAVRLDGVSLHEPGARGEVLVAARSIYVNMQLWSSLWLRGASLDEVDLLQPYVNVRIRKDGTVNLKQLVPPSAAPAPGDQDKGEAHWRIGKLGVHLGRIDLHDDTRPTPFTALFSPLNLALSDLSSRPDRDGGYTLHAETGDGEALDWHGSVAMQPVRSEGQLQISHLKATTPWRYLQDQLPVIVDDGHIGISGHYSLVADKGVTFALDHGRVVIDDLALHQRGPQPLAIRLKQLDLSGVEVKWPEQNAGFATLTLQGLHVSDHDSGADQMRFGQLQLAGARYLPGAQAVALSTLALQQWVLTDAGEQPPLLTLPALRLQGFAVGLGDHAVRIDRVVLEKGDLVLRRDHDGTLNWQTQLSALAGRLATETLPATAPAPATAAKTAATNLPAEKPWTATLGELDLTGFRAGIEDRVPADAVKTSLENIDLRLLPRQSATAPHVLDGSLDIGTGGHLALKGSFSEQPLSARADIDLQALKLPPFAPYAATAAHFVLEKGALDIGGTFSFSRDKNMQAAFRGNIAVHDFAANDPDQNERFLAWNRLAVNGLDWQLAPGHLFIHEVRADKPFMRLIIGQDKTLNLSHVLVAAPAQADKTSAPAASRTAAVTPAKPATPYPLRIGHVRVRDGAMLFADLTLKPSFATGIQSLDGDISGLSSDPASRATVKLDGRVDQYGKALISGSINPLSSSTFTDIGFKFSNLELTTLTPYSARFAGYRIDKGKLSLDLNYKINNRQLDASNKVVLNQLTLGDKVASPDALNLPLKLAVAILKDRDGVIDIDLPVSGSLDDPKFRIGPVIWKAFVNLLTKAATAPFTLIAGLVGGGQDMDSLNFASGQAVLAPEELAKLDKLAAALAQRPALAVEVRGAFDPQADALAIRTAKFDAVYQQRLAAGGKALKTLETLFREKMGSEALAQQRALNLKPVENAADSKAALQLAEDNYQRSLRNELIAREAVQDSDLRQLALERAHVVHARLVETDKVDEARVFMQDPVVAQASNGHVVMKVALTAN